MPARAATADRYEALAAAMAEVGHPLDASAGPVITNFPIWMAETTRIPALALPDEPPRDVLDLANDPRFKAKLVVLLDAGSTHWPADLDAGVDGASCFRELDLGPRDPAGRRPARRCPRVRDRLSMNDGPYTQRPMEPARAETDSRDTRFDDVQTRIGEAQEAERSRLAQEIHDGPAQALSNAIFQVEYIERVIDSDPLLARTELRYLRELLRRELGDVRAFISQLRPPLLDQYGLDGAIMDTIDRTRTLTGLIITSDLAAPANLLSDREQTVVLRVTQEALQNVRKHAAAAHVVVSTQLDGALGARGPRRWTGVRPRRDGRTRQAQLRLAVHARACRVDRRPIRRTIEAGGRYRRPSGDPDRTGRRRRGEHMTAMDYSGPERRRGGPDRRALDEITQILVVDDHALFRMGIANILGHEPDFEIVAEADDSRTAIDRAMETSPDIILMDLSLPAPGGIETTQRIKRELPACGIIVLAQTEDEDALFDAIKAGAAAFILKDVGPDDLVTIIRRVVAGEYLINDKVFSKPAVASRVLKEFRELAVYGQDAAPIFAPLSPREVEILDNIAQGMTNKQVAYALSISEQTVKNHMSSILRKLSVNDRTQAVVYAMRQGWIRMPED